MKKTPPAPSLLAVCPGDDLSRGPAGELAEELDLPLLPLSTDPRRCTSARAVLLVYVNGIALQLTGKQAPGPVSVDFGESTMRHRRGAGHNELLGRAVGIGKKDGLRVFDATAGLGRDSFVLADLGAQVTLCERHPVVAAMLRSGLQLAQSSTDPWLAGAAARMTLVASDAMELPAEQLQDFDVIYLDPMFRQRDQRAAVKKEMALFQFLLQEEPDSNEDLLHWALASPVARVVVKRPPRAASLADVKPSHSIKGKAVRYDVHVLSGLN
ncbi:class I SAM-dependent methyltransferase [Seongchinamella unica]|uniref:class I SAM-dependent methyltransferase n=1 Tax=Seongchinamella unica TaxID=2547392 RepID=UPI0014048DE3|nr:class I SAM-dependent methyltransferase [Seongchinamella unica]